MVTDDTSRRFARRILRLGLTTWAGLAVFMALFVIVGAARAVVWCVLAMLILTIGKAVARAVIRRRRPIARTGERGGGK